jgi:hypothetical protein
MIFRFVVETRSFTFDSTVSRPALGAHIAPLFYGYHGIFFGGYSVRSVKLTTHCCMAEKLRMPPLTHMFPLQEYELKHRDKFSFFFYLCVWIYVRTEIAVN